MKKPTCYLWKKDFQTEEEFENVKNTYWNSGFRVVTFCDGPAGKNIHGGIREIIKNHCNACQEAEL